jgi:hypothetical protein
MKDVPAAKLRSMLGLSKVTYAEARGSLAVVDPTLADKGG